MSYKVIYIPEGIPNLQPLFPGLNLSQVEQWYVVAYDNQAELIASTRNNFIESVCNEKDYRIHFVNSLGEIDSINFDRGEIITEIKSDSWTKSLGATFDRKKGGSYRQNIQSNEIIEAENNSYSESDQYWIKECFETGNAWLEMDMPEGFNESTKKEYVPIEILDSKFIIRKKENRYQYTVKIKFAMSNANIILR